MRVPRSTLPLTAEAPPLPGPPRQGAFDSDVSRALVVHARLGAAKVRLFVIARLDVWTTVHRLAATNFVVRETWGRLGTRRPRRLLQIHDEALAGVLVRVRPERDGTVSFFAEVSAVLPGAPTAVGIYHGARVSLSPPARYGYRFWGRASGEGIAARWGDLEITIEAEPWTGVISTRDVPALREFRAGDESGMVAGMGAAETFREVWKLVEPRHIVADGVERKEYRLMRRREAAGFTHERKEYGATFALHDR